MIKIVSWSSCDGATSLVTDRALGVCRKAFMTFWSHGGKARVARFYFWLLNTTIFEKDNQNETKGHKRTIGLELLIEISDVHNVPQTGYELSPYSAPAFKDSSFSVKIKKIGVKSLILKREFEFK